MSADVAITLAAAVVAAIVVIGAITALPWLYDCRLAGPRIEVVLFRLWPVYRLPISNVESVAKVSRREVSLDRGGALRLGNRPFGPCVLVIKRKGLFRRLVLTPADADAFIDAVNAQM